jgi:hypothetical protein
VALGTRFLGRLLEVVMRGAPVGNETVTTVSELELVELTQEPEENHWGCWDCDFDICGNGGYNASAAIADEEDITCEVCRLMDELDDFKDVPCKHCGSVLWAVPPDNR